jgi:hypothetical protein
MYTASTLPGTYTFSSESWRNKSWGLYDIDRTTESGVVRIGVDGSRASVIESRSYSKYFFLKDSSSFKTLYREDEHLAYAIDERARKIGVVPCVARRMVGSPPLVGKPPCSPVQPQGADDAQCSQAAKRVLAGGKLVGLGWTAGLRTARYQYIAKTRVVNGRPIAPFTSEVALAPGLGCEVVESTYITYNSISLPIEYHHFVTRSFTRVVSGPDEFSLPRGYEIRGDYLPARFRPPID